MLKIIKTNSKINIIKILFLLSLLTLFFTTNTSAADPISEIEKGTNQLVQWAKRGIAIFAGTPLVVWALVFVVRDVFKLIQKTADSAVKKDLVSKIILLLVAGGVITWLLSST